MSKTKLYYTYKTTNLINGCYYFGKHVQNNGKIDNYIGSGKILRLAIKKYGKENFKKEIIEFYSSLEDLAQGEKELISKEHLESADCYNLKPGGEGGIPYGDHHPFFGKKHSPESKKKMSDAKIGVKHPQSRNDQKSIYTTGRKHTEESKKKMSTVKKERMTDEIKQKIRIAQIGINKPHFIGNKFSAKKIRCLNNDTIYNSIKDAHNILGISTSSIIQVLKGRLKSTSGYVFEYVDK